MFQEAHVGSLAVQSAQMRFSGRSPIGLMLTSHGCCISIPSIFFFMASASLPELALFHDIAVHGAAGQLVRPRDPDARELLPLARLCSCHHTQQARAGEHVSAPPGAMACHPAARTSDQHPQVGRPNSA